MRHTREEVIQRTEKEFEMLDGLVANLSEADWQKPVPRPEAKDPWTVKDALAHITHWKADVIRSIHGRRRPPEERGLNWTDGNRLIYLRWRDSSPREVLAWHRQVQADLLAALHTVPDDWFTGKDRRPDWPNDLAGHVAYHRVKDIESALTGGK
jgi:hypothetical protein